MHADENNRWQYLQTAKDKLLNTTKNDKREQSDGKLRDRRDLFIKIYGLGTIRFSLDETSKKEEIGSHNIHANEIN